MGFFVGIFALARSLAFHVTKRIKDTKFDSTKSTPNMSIDSIAKEESRPPSPVPRLTKTELVSSALKRLGELEEKVDMLQSKPNVMPYEKEELLNAAVYRVDALEAELIATKKVQQLLFFLHVSIFKKKICMLGYHLPLNCSAHQLPSHV